MTTSNLIRVKLDRLTKRSVTVRLPDGTYQNIPGGKVLMVYCDKRDLEAHVAGTLRDKELDPTLDEEGNLVVMATALWA